MELLLRVMIRVAENAALLIAGLGLGYLAVWGPPGLLWPVIIGSLALTLGGKLMFEGLLSALGVGLVIASTVSLGYFTMFYMGVGLD